MEPSVKMPFFKTYKNFGLFVLIGVTGFAIEYGLISVLIYIFDTNPYLPRVVSFPIALLTTWILNRTFTYRVMTPVTWLELGRYLGANILAQTSNIILYMLACSPLIGFSPLISLILASTFSVLISMVVYQRYVFIYEKKKDL